jgi:hypothetical protein
MTQIIEISYLTPLYKLSQWIYTDLKNDPDDGVKSGNPRKTFIPEYFSYIVAVSFIGGGNRSTRRKPQTCHKSLTNFIT